MHVCQWGGGGGGVISFSYFIGGGLQYWDQQKGWAMRFLYMIKESPTPP